MVKHILKFERFTGLSLITQVSILPQSLNHSYHCGNVYALRTHNAPCIRYRDGPSIPLLSMPIKYKYTRMHSNIKKTAF